ncbi:hypothetical protein [Candidatus Sarmatiella mevalonica]|uniref:hypothetical protein n=1 Tax=Candidatus Sarmatiella mevalonica TaxID=2770581 RepID=UPI0019209968|nr:hypothetical protein [Candidatus Sarmatiella mevalonica]
MSKQNDSQPFTQLNKGFAVEPSRATRMTIQDSRAIQGELNPEDPGDFGEHADQFKQTTAGQANPSDNKRHQSTEQKNGPERKNLGKEGNKWQYQQQQERKNVQQNVPLKSMLKERHQSTEQKNGPERKNLGNVGYEQQYQQQQRQLVQSAGLESDNLPEGYILKIIAQQWDQKQQQAQKSVSPKSILKTAQMRKQYEQSKSPKKQVQSKSPKKQVHFKEPQNGWLSGCGKGPGI